MSENTCGACRQNKPLFPLTMAFQPVVDLESGRIDAYEALVRGLAGEGAAEVMGAITADNRYQFDQACRVKAINLAKTLGIDRQLNINFMPNAVYEPAACIKTTLEAAQRVGFSLNRIMFEFTEDERMTDVAHVKHIISEYRKFGFMTAIDDFGAGYAGLNLLSNLRPDLIKIDMQLIRDIQNNKAKQAIVAGIVSIAREMDLMVLAEGIESADELRVLRAAGINLFQGFYFAKPLIDQLPFISFEAAPHVR